MLLEMVPVYAVNLYCNNDLLGIRSVSLASQNCSQKLQKMTFGSELFLWFLNEWQGVVSKLLESIILVLYLTSLFDTSQISWDLQTKRNHGTEEIRRCW